MPTAPTVAQHFEGKAPAVRAIYEAVRKAAAALGPYRESPKKTSIHLDRATAFAGVATRKDAIVLTLKSAEDFAHPRAVKRVRTSAHRWHVELRLTSPKDVDAELRRRLASAYELSA